MVRTNPHIRGHGCKGLIFGIAGVAAGLWLLHQSLPLSVKALSWVSALSPSQFADLPQNMRAMSRWFPVGELMMGVLYGQGACYWIMGVQLAHRRIQRAPLGLPKAIAAGKLRLLLIFAGIFALPFVFMGLLLLYTALA